MTSSLTAIAPALLFLCTAVPLAALLDELGFFEALAASVVTRDGTASVAVLWVVAALTAAVLNLDTTIVLLTPLYVRLARRASVDPLSLAVIPLALASLASSMLPISNLTILIVGGRIDTPVAMVVAHLGLPTIVSVVVGWWAYRHRYPAHLQMDAAGGPVDRSALTFGGTVIVGLLVGFVAGPEIGVDPWVVAAVADAVLMARVRVVPWRRVPLATATAIAGLAAIVAAAVPRHFLTALLHHQAPGSVAVSALAGAGAANVVNNIPATLLAANGLTRPTWGLWAWLLGIDAGAMLLPWGAIANLLWWRLAGADGVELTLRRYLRESLAIGAPALVAGIVVLVAERIVVG